MPETPATAPRSLVWSNAFFGLSGAGLIVTLMYVRGAGYLGASIVWSMVILGLYQTILLLVLQGIVSLRQRMRR